MKSLGLLMAVLFSTSILAAQENMCDRILNDILKTSGLGNSVTDFNSSYLKSSTQDLANVMPEYKKIMEQMDAKKVQVQKWREQGRAENELYQQAVKLPEGKSMVDPFDMLELLSEDKFKKDPAWRGLYVIDKKGPVADALLAAKKMSAFYEQQCFGNEAVVEPCVSMRGTLDKMKTNLFKQLKKTAGDSDKAIKAVEKKAKPHLDKVNELMDLIKGADAVYSGLNFQRFIMALNNPDLATWDDAVNQAGGGSFDGMRITTLTTKIANNYDKTRIQILEETRRSLLTQQGGIEAVKRNLPQRVPVDRSRTRVEQLIEARRIMNDATQPEEVRAAAKKINDDFKAELKADDQHLQVGAIRGLINARLEDTETELSLLKESPAVQVVTRNGITTSFIIGPPVNLSSSPECKGLELDVVNLKPEMLSKNAVLQKLVFAAYGVKNNEEYKAKVDSGAKPTNFDKYAAWIAKDEKDRAPRRSSGFVTPAPATGPAGR